MHLMHLPTCTINTPYCAENELKPYAVAAVQTPTCELLWLGCRGVGHCSGSSSSGWNTKFSDNATGTMWGKGAGRASTGAGVKCALLLRLGGAGARAVTARWLRCLWPQKYCGQWLSLMGDSVINVDWYAWLCKRIQCMCS